MRNGACTALPEAGSRIFNLDALLLVHQKILVIRQKQYICVMRHIIRTSMIELS
jgi:hypothetical protein